MQANNSYTVHEEGFNGVREDIVGVTLGEPFAGMIGGNNVANIKSDFNSDESDEEDETLYEFDSE